MSNHLKTSPAALLCLVFFFRLLFLNVGYISAATSSSTKQLNKQYTLFKKRAATDEVSAQPDVKDYRIVEFCEEGPSKQEYLTKAKAPAILTFFDSFLDQTTISTKANEQFDHIKCDLYPKKYLALSILRI